MGYRLQGLLDIGRVQKLFDSLNEALPFTSLVVDSAGATVTSTGMPRICTELCAACPSAATTGLCAAWENRLVVETIGPSKVYRCPLGLVDSVTPIAVDGENLGCTYVGRILLEPPDRARLQALAREHDLDADACLAALEAVPVLSRPDFLHSVKIMQRATEIITAIAVERARELEAEAELRRRQRVLDAILEASPVGYAANTMDDGKVRFVSRRFEEIYGLPHGAVRTVEEFFDAAYADEQQRAAISARITTDMASGDLRRMHWDDIELTTIDGQRKVVSASNIPLFEQNLMISTVEDITGKSEAEEALREASEFSQQVIASVQEGIVVHGRDQTLELWNAFMERLTGVPAAAALGRMSSEVFPEYARALSGPLIGEALRGADKGPIDFELTSAATGCAAWAAAMIGPLRDAAGDVVGAITIVRDITHRKLAQQSLRAEETRLEQAQAIAHVGNWELDLATGKVRGSEEAFRIWGLDHTGPYLPLTIVRDLVVPHQRDEIDSAVADLIAGRAGFDMEFDFHRASDGELRRVHSKAELITNGENVPVAVLGAFQDVTELKAAEREALAVAERLRRTLDGSVTAMGMIVERRDPYTAGHQRRVARLAETIAEDLGLSETSRVALRLAGEVHDIGKVAVPVEILTKPGNLSRLEFEVMKAHPGAGAAILSSVEFDGPVAEIVLNHHERLNGSGYPNGLKGNEIPIEARVIAIADVVEAMASHRPYRPARGVEAALDEIHTGSGALYDEDVVAACWRCFDGGFTIPW